MNARKIFDDVASELDELVPKLAGRIVATGQTDRYKFVLHAAKAFREAVDTAAKTSETESPRNEGDTCRVPEVTNSIRDKKTAEQVLRHCEEITALLDLIVDLQPFDKTVTRKKTAAVYRALGENIEEPILREFPGIDN
jgi:hypothetical protein